MTWSLCRHSLLLALCALLPLGRVHADEDQDRDGVALRAFRGDVERLTVVWNGVLKKTQTSRQLVEAARQSARRDERTKQPTSAQRKWRERWEATAPKRTAMQDAIDGQMRAWTKPLDSLFAAHGAAPLGGPAQAEVAKIMTDRVAAWVDVGEPDELLVALTGTHVGLRHAFVLSGDDAPRRTFLRRVLERIAATPGTSDLDALVGAVGWGALFVANRPPNEGLDGLSRDLVLLLTERGEDGIQKSDGQYYRAGRFKDRGFGRRYRDGSDQVRHFAWALRMFTVSEKPDFTAKLLLLKEQRDARTRKQPVNKADLALNEAARALVSRVRGGEAGVSALAVAIRDALAR